MLIGFPSVLVRSPDCAGCTSLCAKIILRSTGMERRRRFADMASVPSVAARAYPGNMVPGNTVFPYINPLCRVPYRSNFQASREARRLPKHLWAEEAPPQSQLSQLSIPTGCWDAVQGDAERTGCRKAGVRSARLTNGGYVRRGPVLDAPPTAC